MNARFPLFVMFGSLGAAAALVPAVLPALGAELHADLLQAALFLCFGVESAFSGLSAATFESSLASTTTVSALGTSACWLLMTTGRFSGVDDLEALRRVRDAVRPTVGLHVDDNQGWSAVRAVEVTTAWGVCGFGVELVEQPLAAAPAALLTVVAHDLDAGLWQTHAPVVGGAWCAGDLVEFPQTAGIGLEGLA
jgi:hypothetical protein